MTQLPKELYGLLSEFYKLLGLDEAELKEIIDLYEEVALKRMLLAIVKKLPKQEREPIGKLISEIKNDPSKKDELKTKLQEWLNEDELIKLYKKIADQLFKELLQEAYQEADEETKKKLEEMFTKEALKE